MRNRQLQDIFIGGKNNQSVTASRDRLIKGNTYKDLSTVCIVPVVGPIPWKVISSWWSLMTPMNQKFLRIGVEKMEVADAYNAGIQTILDHPELSKWKYVLSLEHDNCPPPDGLMKLYESMDKYDVVGGLYWTKGENGQPMCYGDPQVMPKNFIPQLPPVDCIREYNGLGMGFSLFKMDIFRKMPKPWFKTVQEYTRGDGVRLGTQDLYFYGEAAKYGYRFACDGRVKVGLWDQNTETIW